MLNKDIVSLIIPCYNGEQFVERCMRNILEQDYVNNIEMILINDGSTDKTEEIIFQMKDILVQRIINNCYIKPMPLPLH